MTEPLSGIFSMSLLGRVSSEPALWPHLLSGALDEDLISAFVYHTDGSLRQEERMGQAREALENFKSFMRRQIQGAFDGLARDLDEETERNKRIEMDRIRKSMSEMNKPAPEGTVKELAERYGVSISVVRKYKAEGRLTELAMEAASKTHSGQQG